ncbi:MAG: TetR/AcrR family transcriptional regulator [Pseudomonadota bacterium]|nr:TetR/AcrR family transcriptional regulator [Pseudomonadota bacterium]
MDTNATATTPDTPNKKGRPPAFDRQTALAQAKQLFWTLGYEATSIHDLTQAMGISPSSLYAAFGSKANLFQEVLQNYTAQNACSIHRFFEQYTDYRCAMAAYLQQIAIQLTQPDHPRGCMVTSAATNCKPASQDIVDQLTKQRIQQRQILQDKIKQAIAAQQLPTATDAEGLANTYAALIHGMTTLARDGATQQALLQISENAMQLWDQAGQPLTTVPSP